MPVRDSRLPLDDDCELCCVRSTCSSDQGHNEISNFSNTYFHLNPNNTDERSTELNALAEIDQLADGQTHNLRVRTATATATASARGSCNMYTVIDPILYTVTSTLDIVANLQAQNHSDYKRAAVTALTAASVAIIISYCCLA